MKEKILNAYYDIIDEEVDYINKCQIYNEYSNEDIMINLFPDFCIPDNGEKFMDILIKNFRQYNNNILYCYYVVQGISNQDINKITIKNKKIPTEFLNIQGMCRIFLAEILPEDRFSTMKKILSLYSTSAPLKYSYLYIIEIYKYQNKCPLPLEILEIITSYISE